jgi:sugar lactone lactonase YvrE
MVTGAGFHSPTDAVASLDGTTFFFAAFRDSDNAPAIFSVPSAGGDVEELASGAPLAYPSGLVLSCDGETLFIADAGSTGEDESSDVGAVYATSTASVALTQLDIGALTTPNALAFDADCVRLYVSGVNAAGEGTVVHMDPDGGDVTVLHAGDPLVSPSGLNIDADGVAWVMDHLAIGDDGRGLLFAISDGSAPQPVVSGLNLGAPAGVSLRAGGVTAVIPSRNADGEGQLLSVNTGTMAMDVLEAPEMIDPAGIRTAREAALMVVVDSEGGAIFRAE